MAEAGATGRIPFSHPASLVATVFGAGLSPVAPGTVGSLVALPLAWLLHWAGGPGLLVLGVVVVFFAGWWAAGVYGERVGVADSSAIVIDEVAGQWLVLAAVPLDLIYFAIGFALFRLFDIVKPWPVGWADRRIKGGLGVMLDDVLAGIYGAAILLLVLWFVEGRLVL